MGPGNYQGLAHRVLPRAEQDDLLARMAAARDGGDAAQFRRLRDQAVAHNLRLCGQAARSLRGRGLDEEDLIGEGVIGLMRACDLFDPARGIAFSTYAAWWIRATMQRALARVGSTIRLPSNLLDAIRRCRRAAAAFATTRGREPNAEELAKCTGLSMTKVRRVLALDTREPLSLATPLGAPMTRGGSTLGDLLAGSEGDALDAIEQAERAHHARALLNMLDPRSRAILEARSAGATLAESAAVARGISRERVRQLERDALVKLRTLASVPGVPGAPGAPLAP